MNRGSDKCKRCDNRTWAIGGSLCVSCLDEDIAYKMRAAPMFRALASLMYWAGALERSKGLVIGCPLGAYDGNDCECGACIDARSEHLGDSIKACNLPPGLRWDTIR